MKPSISSLLLKTNYEGMGEQDKEEFGRDFDEILDLALIGLKYKAQLSQERADKRTETHACDLISRRTAIDAINCDITVTGRQNAELVAATIGTFVDRIKALPSAQPEQIWIPCSERLPEEKSAGNLKQMGFEKRSEYVLATIEVQGERMTAKVCTWDGKWHWNMKYAFPDFKVVAWMPLPEPYKEGEKGEPDERDL